MNVGVIKEDYTNPYHLSMPIDDESNEVVVISPVDVEQYNHLVANINKIHLGLKDEVQFKKIKDAYVHKSYGKIFFNAASFDERTYHAASLFMFHVIAYLRKQTLEVEFSKDAVFVYGGISMDRVTVFAQIKESLSKALNVWNKLNVIYSVLGRAPFFVITNEYMKTFNAEEYLKDKDHDKHFFVMGKKMIYVETLLFFKNELNTLKDIIARPNMSIFECLISGAEIEDIFRVKEDDGLSYLAKMMSFVNKCKLTISQASANFNYYIDDAMFRFFIKYIRSNMTPEEKLMWMKKLKVIKVIMFAMVVLLIIALSVYFYLLYKRSKKTKDSEKKIEAQKNLTQFLKDTEPLFKGKDAKDASQIGLDMLQNNEMLDKFAKKKTKNQNDKVKKESKEKEEDDGNIKTSGINLTEELVDLLLERRKRRG
jgi:flagellar basal body-associated protein FliL